MKFLLYFAAGNIIYSLYQYFVRFSIQASEKFAEIVTRKAGCVVVSYRNVIENGK